eukprot:CAMPEP_0181089914 /NCGR_PEP_ID=MMETSP1071-20121207/7557_1 /TAXON_ID=35127 /ORGANISM="Thalassiosira sp., Strain NH16" /LENGTH=51 /DNA_ID=CAMNT_0023171895 /DNA_START=568 /DNA_END=723 /DNA_ORIENTATION=-
MAVCSDDFRRSIELCRPRPNAPSEDDKVALVSSAAENGVRPSSDDDDNDEG